MFSEFVGDIVISYTGYLLREIGKEFLLFALMTGSLWTNYLNIQNNYDKKPTLLKMWKSSTIWKGPD